MTARMESLIAPSLLLSLLGAALTHALVLWGIAFKLPERDIQSPPDQLIEIMVVNNPQAPTASEQPEYLAQLDQEGGGDPDAQGRPSAELAMPEPSPVTSLGEEPVAEVAPQPQPEPVEEKIETPDEPETPPETVTEIAPPPRPEPEVQPEPVADQQVPTPAPVVEPAPEKPRPKQVSAADLLASTQREIERLTAEIDRRSNPAVRGPKRKFISASTQEYRFASYMDAWRRKVERIGNLNYPQEAKRQRMFGSLVLTVGIRHDGRVESIYVDRSSGHKLLDEAAKQIVRFASPFAPLPDNIRKDVDILHITRTWHFRETNRLASPDR